MRRTLPKVQMFFLPKVQVVFLPPMQPGAVHL